MAGVVRLSFSIEQPLMERLEQLVREGAYANRSEFIRDMIRERLVAKQWERNEEVVGTITLVYNHHARGLTDKLTHTQHHHHDVILASTHIHLGMKTSAPKSLSSRAVLTKFSVSRENSSSKKGCFTPR